MPINDKTPRPQEFAAVDLGSNSFHMVIAREVDGAMQIIGRLKQRVHLADGLDANSMLSEEAMERGLNCLSLFAERLQGFSPSSVCIVGTHTLRQALNAPEFLKRAEKVIPYPIEIISGNEEARLIFMGVEHTQPEKGRKLVIDIGGGSTELVIGEELRAASGGEPPHGLRQLRADVLPGRNHHPREFPARAHGCGTKTGKSGLAVPYSGLERGAGCLGFDQGRT
ncbi:Ppx/GppA phosphatase [Enterobacter cancerogenus]|uniref:Ppx/GppA phosphatase n=1 Tax=Enterobacter cancerogenus TaxID=69218 RepID=A0A484YYX6_9ENTR|nr:Ppx/GppA phosphatase [Enterobacter cancerogenus]